jgi:hypothetical protein
MEKSEMTKPASTLSRHDLEAKIVRHIWNDPEFRKEFVADPAGAFTKYLKIPATSLPKIVAHDEKPGTWHIVLPAKPTNAKELSEQDLEKVAGGATPSIIPTLILSAETITLVASPIQSWTVDDNGW